MKAINCLIVVLTLCFAGCGNVFRVPKKTSNPKPPETKQTTQTHEAKTRPIHNPNNVPISETQKSHNPENVGMGIRVSEIRPIQIHAQDTDGIYLGDYIKAIHLCSGDPITNPVFSNPREGSLKAYPTGHSRYYPPDRKCSDSVEIRLIADDGCTRKVRLPIQVHSPKPINVVSRVTHPKIKITVPGQGSKISGRRCDLSGQTQGILNGTTLDLFVEDRWGNIYLQNSHPQVSDDQYSGWVFLGDEAGHGIGDYFTIWAQAPNSVRSNSIRVLRSD